MSKLVGGQIKMNIDFYVRYSANNFNDLCFRHASQVAVLHNEHIDVLIYDSSESYSLEPCVLCDIEDGICPNCRCTFEEHSEWCANVNYCKELEHKYFKGRG